MTHHDEPDAARRSSTGHGAPGFLGDGSPEPIDHPGGRPALLAFHGFGSTPREFDPLIDVARDLDLQLRAPLLRGHGTHPRDLAHTRFADWYGGAEEDFSALSAGGKVILVGLSTGALVAMKLAALHGSAVSGLVVLANALTLTSPIPSWPLWALSYLRAPDFSVPKRAGPDIHDPVARRRHLTYDAQPIQAAADLRRAGARTQRLLPRIHCPVFVAHGQDDHVCPVSNAWLVADGVGTTDVEVMILPRSWHIVTKDLDAEALMRALGTFLRRTTKTPKAHSPVEP